MQSTLEAQPKNWIARLAAAIVLLVLAAGLITSIATKTSNIGDWGDFEQFSKLDRAEDSYSCKSLIDTKIVWESLDFTSRDTEVDVLDYLVWTGNKFNNCQSEIQRYANAWCEENKHKITQSIENTKHSPVPVKQISFCKSWLQAAASEKNDSYKAPTKTSPWLSLTIDNKTYQINPEYIEEIEYAELLENYLWGISITTATRKHYLYISDKTHWLTAKKELISLALHMPDKSDKDLQSKEIDNG